MLPVRCGETVRTRILLLPSSFGLGRWTSFSRAAGFVQSGMDEIVKSSTDLHRGAGRNWGTATTSCPISNHKRKRERAFISASYDVNEGSGISISLGRVRL